MFVPVFLGGLAAISLALVLWQLIVALRFPLHRRIPQPTFAPDITILKPLKGWDAETRGCLESWMTQQYRGRVQILFGVHSADDPVCAVVRELTTKFPRIDAQLVVCPKALGPNAKVSTLIQLQRLAQHEKIAVSDADVHVPSDFLAQAVAPLANDAVGLVNCFYQLPGGRRFAERCEAFAVNGDFWSQVLQARSLKPIDFALGAVMLTTQTRLREIGAFESLVDYLADDYQLGNRIAKAGGEIVISPLVVECRSGPTSAREVWNHQLRWARTIRVSQPLPFFFSILNDSALWVGLWLLCVPSGASAFGALAYGLIRGAGAVASEQRLTRNLNLTAPLFALVCDVVRPFIWALSFAGNSVAWRGRKFRVRRGGKLSPV